jgi:hypothetical protein
VKKQALLLTAITLSVAAFAVNGLCQAAAEYSATTAAAATAATQAGSAIGNAVNGATQQAAGQLVGPSGTPAAQSRQAARRARRAAVEGRALAVPVRPVESPRAMRLDFNHATDARPASKERAAGSPCPPPGQVSGDTKALADNKTPVENKTDSCKQETPPEYPSVVHLSFPKN